MGLSQARIEGERVNGGSQLLVARSSAEIERTISELEISLSLE
jgi:hypothetical protein